MDIYAANANKFNLYNSAYAQVMDPFHVAFDPTSAVSAFFTS